MKMNQTILASAALAGFTFASTTASAQELGVEAEAEAEVEATEEEPEAEAEAEAPVEEAPAEQEAEPEPEPEPMMEEPAEEPMEEEAMEEEVEAEEEMEEEGGAPFLFAFADAYAAFQTTRSGDAGGGGIYASKGPDGAAQSGFGLNWIGIDLGYDSEKWGVTGSIRAGDAVYQYGVGSLGGAIDGATGIGITNAYATWKPVDGLALDFGAFGTIYGAEVAESWQNLNYTRGALYFNFQPFWHTGMRAEYAAGDFVVRGLVTNAANSSTLGEYGMDLGLQGGYDNGTFGIVVGALQSLAPESRGAEAGGQFLDTFFDVVLTVAAGDFSLVGNFDMNLGYSDYSTAFWGGSLAAGYAFTDSFGLALRGEYLDFDGDASLLTGTLTVDTKPTGSENFVVRWDNRVEIADEDVFTNLDGDPADTSLWFSSTLGFVAYADLL